MAGHETIEKNIGLMLVLVLLVVSVGGLVQIVPLFNMTLKPITKPYPALQLTGRDIYIREGCNFCHTQMIRPFRAETERYGHYSVASEFTYDRPHLWGSKRTGPDLHRVSLRKYTDDWHRAHLMNPRSVVPESIMPSYPWLAKNKLDGKLIVTKMRVLKWRGHPYSDKEIAAARKKLEGKTEMDAVIAYLQNMGTSLKSRR